MAWKIKSRKEIYKNRFMTLTEDRVVTDSGVELVFGIVHKKEAVGIIPVDGEYTYLVGEYRYAVDYFSWGFPQGHFEHDSIIEAAKHELEEEAGLKAESMNEIGRFYPAPGHNTQEYRVYLAKKLRDVGQNPNPDEEGMLVKKVRFIEVDEMIRKGEIKDGPTIAMCHILRLYLEKNQT